MNDPQSTLDTAAREVGLTRRSIVTAGAWAVPVLTLAVASPAMAVSAQVGVLSVSAEVSGMFTNDMAVTVTIHITGVPSGLAALITLPGVPSAHGPINGKFAPVAQSGWTVSPLADGRLLTYSAPASSSKTPGSSILTALWTLPVTRETYGKYALPLTAVVNGLTAAPAALQIELGPLVKPLGL